MTLPNNNNFEDFKLKLGKYIKNSRKYNQTKLSAANEIDISLSKYMAFEEPSKEYGRQSIPLDLLFSIAKRDNLTLRELIEKIDSQDKKTTTKIEKSEVDLCIEHITHTLKQERLQEEIFQVIYLFYEVQSKFPKNNPINYDPELWIIYLLKNLVLLGQEDLTDEIYGILKKVDKKIKNNEINGDIDTKFNSILMQSTLEQLIKNKTKELLELQKKIEVNNSSFDSSNSLEN